MIVSGQKKLIDVLVDQGKVKRELAVSWQSLTNLEVEEKLKSEHMVSAEDISRGYADLYKLPYVSLKDHQIIKEVLELVPESLAKEYKIISYAKDKKTLGPEVVRIAIAEPSRLTANLKNVLSDLEKRKGFKIELEITSLDDFLLAVAKYRAPSIEPLKPSASVPKTQIKTVDLDQIAIPYDVITKFPKDIAQKYQMIVFEAPHPSFIKVALVDPEDKKNRDILDFIKEKNDIAIEEYNVSPSEIARALHFYEKPEPPKMVIEEPPKPSVPMSEEASKTEEKLEPIHSDEIKKPFVPEPETLKPLSHESQKETPEAIPEVKSPEKTHQLVLPDENDLDKFVDEKVRDVYDIEKIAKSGHVPKIVAAFVILAVAKKASDIHIEPAEKNVRIRFRIDGLLRDVIKLPIEIHPAIVSRVKILSKLKIDESRIPQDGRFDAIATGHAIDLRVSTLPTVHGEKIALRILDKSAHLYTLEELGLTGRSLKVLLENMNKPYGVILSTGPTGSGKTTTLYAILNRISNASVNIITLEDPVEYEMGGINQCQIKPKIGFTFANGLRSILRQDPNIIMVGEIRDSETAQLATHAALTGHLVLSTLHTNDAAGALPRIVDMGVEPFFITSLINAIIAQRLVRKLCPKCKRPAHIPEPILKEIEAELSRFNLPKPYQFFEGAGCSECELGYKGRIGIFEVLTMSRSLENLVLEHKPSSAIKDAATEEGMVTIKQDGLVKALKGLTTVSEVLRVITV